MQWNILPGGDEFACHDHIVQCSGVAQSYVVHCEPRRRVAEKMSELSNRYNIYGK